MTTSVYRKSTVNPTGNINMKFVLVLIVVTVLAAQIVHAEEDGTKDISAEHQSAILGTFAELAEASAQLGGGVRAKRAAPSDAELHVLMSVFDI
ncbi:hypothetical protein CBL_12291 [Carabus blaptoides fortunei]